MTTITSDELLQHLHLQGVALWLEGGELRWRAASGALPASCLEQLRVHTAALVRKLEIQESGSGIALEPRRPGGPAPLTSMQLRWLNYIGKYQPTFGNRLTQHLAMWLRGPLDTELLRTCLARLLHRHESLRTRIVLEEGIAIQRIDAAAGRELEVVEVSAAGGSDDVNRAVRLADAFMARKVERAVGPLFAASLFKCSKRQHLLVIGLDHAITDATSNMILLRELWTLYEQGTCGAALSLPDLTLQYTDYAWWLQRTYGLWIKRHESHWRARLHGAPATRLPREATRDGTHCDHYPMFTVALGAGPISRLHALARQERTLLPLVVLALYVAAAAYWLEQRDLIVKFVSHARHRPQLQSIVGLVSNTLHLRMEVAPEYSLQTLVGRIKDELRAAYEHQDFDRVPDLLPECSSDLVFNWLTPPGNQRGTNPAGLEIEPFMLDMPCPHPYFAIFSSTAAGIVVNAWCLPNPAGSAAEEFGRILTLLAEKCSLRPVELIATVARDSGISGGIDR